MLGHSWPQTCAKGLSSSAQVTHSRPAWGQPSAHTMLRGLHGLPGWDHLWEELRQGLGATMALGTLWRWCGSSLLVGHTKICCSRRCQSSSGCLPPQVTPLVNQQWCEPLPACSTDHSLSTQLPQQWDASMGTSQGRGVGTSSP